MSRRIVTHVVLPVLVPLALASSAVVALSEPAGSPAPSAVTSVPSPSSTSAASNPFPAKSWTPSRSSSHAPRPSTSAHRTTTPPPSSAAPRTSAPPASPPGRLLWRGSFDTGNFSEFKTSDNQPEAPKLVTSPVVDGHYAGEYVVPSGGHRSESVPNLGYFHEGDDLWFSWATQLAPGFPVNADTWQVITQWKNDGIGSPPLEIGVNNGRYQLDGGFGWPGDTSDPKPRFAALSLGPASTGVWVHWLVHVHFSSDPDVGFVSLLRDGVQKVLEWHLPGGTLYPKLPSYLKLGYYRDSSLTTPGAVYQDAWRIGTTRGAVS